MKGTTMSNLVTISGNLTADPELKLTGDSGLPLTKFRLATSRRRRTGEKDSNGRDLWEDTDHLYIDVACWNDLAVNCMASLKRGFPVTVTGRLVTEMWEDKSAGIGEDSNMRSRITLKATQVSFDLSNFQLNSIKTTNVSHIAHGTKPMTVKTAADFVSPSETRLSAEDGAAPSFADHDDTDDHTGGPLAASVGAANSSAAGNDSQASVPF